MNWITWKFARLRYVFYTQMLCPLGIHRRTATSIHRLAGLSVTGAKCVFCGQER